MKSDLGSDERIGWNTIDQGYMNRTLNALTAKTPPVELAGTKVPPVVGIDQVVDDYDGPAMKSPMVDIGVKLSSKRKKKHDTITTDQEESKRVLTTSKEDGTHESGSDSDSDGSSDDSSDDSSSDKSSDDDAESGTT